MPTISPRKSQRTTSFYQLRPFFVLLVILIPHAALAETGSVIPSILFERVPDGGIQPQLMRDSTGLTHLTYFKKDGNAAKSRKGNLYYKQRLGAANWTPAIKVSQQSFSHLGPVSKASAMVDEMGRVHVVWFIPGDGYLYSRSDPQRSKFETARAVVTEFTEGLDAEASLSGTGNLITITWHAGDLSNEAARTVYSLTSEDYGATFGNARRTSNPKLGACACCALTTQYDNRNSLQIAYRSAINNDGRHMRFLYRAPDNELFTTRTVGEWNINTCPVSSNHLNGDWLVFETEDQLYKINLASGVEATRLRKSEVRQKHPVVAVNKAGYRLVAWAEANGYFSGGSLALQLYNPGETLIDLHGPGTVRVIDDFSVVAASTLADDRFLIIY